jgi:hypothetical protein
VRTLGALRLDHGHARNQTAWVIFGKQTWVTSRKR